MSAVGVSVQAGGNIRPRRFVKISAPNVVTESGAGGQVFGISQSGTRNAPYSTLNDGFAAIAGENVRVFGVGEVCHIELGIGGITAGLRLKSDANGCGVLGTTAADQYGAVATQTGIQGDFVEVRVEVGVI